MKDSQTSVIRKLDKYLLNFENLIAGISYAVMVILVFWGVIMRYVAKSPNLYGEELSRYLMITSVFIGIAAGCRQKVHLNVELFIGLFPKKVNTAIKAVVRLITTFMYLYMAYQGLLMIQAMKNFGQTSPAMRMPLWIMYTVITLGFVLSFITEVIMYINDFFFKGNLLDTPEEVEES